MNLWTRAWGRKEIISFQDKKNKDISLMVPLWLGCVTLQKYEPTWILLFSDCFFFVEYDPFRPTIFIQNFIYIDFSIDPVFETGTSDRTFMGFDQFLKCPGFSLHPHSFFLYSPCKLIKLYIFGAINQNKNKCLFFLFLVRSYISTECFLHL